jgi:putative nucleotidyltransferase with HDIG domain
LFFGTTLGLGAGVIVFAASRTLETPWHALAIAAAAVLVTELVQVAGDDQSLDPLDAQPFSFASPIHLSVIVLLGTWPAVVLAALGVVIVDFFREAPRRAIAFNASAFALAAAAGGAAFQLAGGTSGSIALPGDLPAFAALAAAYLLVNLTLVNGIAALHAGGPILSELRDVLRTDPVSRAAEAALGLLLAVCVLNEPWALVTCVPLVLVVHRAYERLATLRRETARALETFANIVDERDPSTQRHSARVAQRVEELARGIGLPAARVEQLRWAGRLHDLGKIAVDAHVLNKRGRLDPDELASMHRHPRLSARLLRRFRFAAPEARAVEYHHERFDGEGYYGVEGERVPLAAHMLVIADSFDAMTSDRSYRAGLPRAVALEEIERHAGTQFHPGLARAFVAVQRGEDPRRILSEDEARELRQLRRIERPRMSPLGLVGGGMTPGAFAAVAGAALAFALAAFGPPSLVVPALAASFVGVVIAYVEQRRAVRLSRDVGTVTAAATSVPEAFSALAGSLAGRGAEWVGLARLGEDDLAAAIERQWCVAGAAAPAADALTSWLVRDADERETITAEGFELGRQGWLVALPLSGADRTTQFLIVAFAGKRRTWLELGLRAAQAQLVDALGSAPAGPRPARLAVVS